MIFENTLPKLNDENSCVTSPASLAYNCIAWAIRRDDVWFEPVPSCAWPEELKQSFKPDTLKEFFELQGFKVCDGHAREEGFEKIALYADEEEWTHAARQTDDGKWTSKLGIREDIEHDSPYDLEGEVYGEILCLMKREKS